MTLNGAEASRLCSQVLDLMGTVKIYDLTTSELRVMGALLSGAADRISSSDTADADAPHT
jgi:hypothetical protein